MIEFGVVRSTGNNGLFAFLPLGIRSLDKLTALVKAKLDNINALQVSLPTLVPEELWLKSGRLQNAGPEIMRLKDRHNKRYILGPVIFLVLCSY